MTRTQPPTTRSDLRTGASADDPSRTRTGVPGGTGGGQGGRRGRRGRPALGAVAVAALLGAAGCSSTGDSSLPSAESEVSPREDFSPTSAPPTLPAASPSEAEDTEDAEGGTASPTSGGSGPGEDCAGNDEGTRYVQVVSAAVSTSVSGGIDVSGRPATLECGPPVSYEVDTAGTLSARLVTAEALVVPGEDGPLDEDGAIAYLEERAPAVFALTGENEAVTEAEEVRQP